MLGEDVEDQGGPVDHLDLDDVFQVNQLTRAELTVADDGVGSRFEDDVAQLQRLARTDVGGRVRLVAALEDGVEHLGARRLRQCGQLREGVLRVTHGPRRPDADQHHALQAQLPVLDLGDIFEFGGEPGHTPQRGPLGAVELLAVPLSVDLVAPGDVLFHQGVGPKALCEAFGDILRSTLRILRVLGKGRRGGHWILTSLEVRYISHNA